MKIDVLTGNNLDVLRGFADNCIDSVVTDPPYGLGSEPDAMAMLTDWITTGHHEVKGKGFMGKEWDAFVPQPMFWREVYRVLKPGGHMLVFAGTRTMDLMTLGLRIAGFEIRDSIGWAHEDSHGAPLMSWCYGSGFPKSLNISKALDKQAGAEREVVGEKFNKNRKNGNVACVGLNTESSYDPITAPSTPAAKQWNGWGTALKPAWEPIIIARKPLDGTVAANVLKWGTGGINIDQCRVGLNGEDPPSGSAKRVYANNEFTTDKVYGDNKVTPPSGRFPANVITDGSDAVVRWFPNTTSGKAELGVGSFDRQHNGIYNSGKGGLVTSCFADTGSAARFFKECSFDKNEICTHASIAEKNLSLQKKVEDFVLKLVAIRDSQGDHILKSLILPFMKEIEIALNNHCEIDIRTIRNLETKLDQESKRIVTEMLKENPVKFVEIQKLTSITTIIQNLLSMSGFVESITSNAILNNMVRGEEVYLQRIKYAAKASPAERNAGCEGLDKKKRDDSRKEGNPGGDNPRNRGVNQVHNTHPTVKPISLIRYIARLITPPGGTCLDPFAGSGTTGIACEQEGFNAILIEREQEYIPIINARVSHAQANNVQQTTTPDSQLSLF